MHRQLEAAFTPSSVDGPQATRSVLPIARHREQVLYLVETHATTVIVGETGSGDAASRMACIC
jgi:ATP-dependent RNA helicase DDX35